MNSSDDFKCVKNGSHGSSTDTGFKNGLPSLFGGPGFEL